jgi:hypothetical protein
MSGNDVLIDTSTRVIMLRDPLDHQAFLIQLPQDVGPKNTVNATIAKAKEIADVPMIYEFLDVFPDDLPRLPLDRDVEFKIELLLVLHRSQGDHLECRQMS